MRPSSERGSIAYFVSLEISGFVSDSSRSYAKVSKYWMGWRAGMMDGGRNVRLGSPKPAHSDAN